MQISITFDVEIWCGSWRNLDRRFPKAFRRYVYGESPQGHALPRTLEILRHHGLQGVFFVEPLFSYRFGEHYLREIVELIQADGHSLQLHLHPEWVDEARPALLPGADRKRPYMHQYTLAEQTRLIELGIDALQACGAERPRAFRAGGFAGNRDTLRAVAANGLQIDSSVNPAQARSAVDLPRAALANRPQALEGVMEYPLSTFVDGLGRQRHWQLCSVGLAESQQLVRAAARAGYAHLLLLSHNFELLVPGRARPDPVLVQRFDALCGWLARHQAQHPVVDLPPQPQAETPVDAAPLQLSLLNTARRYVGQARSRLAGLG